MRSFCVLNAMLEQTYYKHWERFWNGYRKESEPPVLADEFPLELIRRSGRLLEIGFGSGRVLRYFLRQGYSVFGVDVAHSAVGFLRVHDGAETPALLRRIGLSSCSHLGLRTGSFQTVICLGILEHYESAQELAAALREIKRVMRDEAIAVVSVPHRISAFIVIELIKRLAGQWHSGRENKFTPSGFIPLVEREGLRCRRYYFRSMDITPARGLLRVPAAILRLFDMLLVRLKWGGHMATYILEKDERSR